MTSEQPETIHVAPSPHLATGSLTTRRMMVDVLIGLAPAVAVAVFMFRWDAVVVVGLCVLCCLAAEAIFSLPRGKRVPLDDYSAVVTGLILGLSLPATARDHLHIVVIGSVAAIGLGKAVFGGLGYNIFNPAMVGRAFVMLSFAKEMGASAYRVAESPLKILSEATPLTVAKEAAKGTAESVDLPELWPLFVGTVNGSLGEISAAALLLGGVYLCVRRVVSWEIPAGTLAAAAVCAGAANLTGLTTISPWHHLAGGALLLGAFFIATDPVTSPLSGRGKFIFGLGIGALVMLIRLFSGYPEGVMFAVLLMNAVVPLIDRWTVPKPLGGPVPEKK